MMRRVVVVAVLGAFVVTSACRSAEERQNRRSRRDEGIVLGAVLPLTGPRASYGVAVKSGIDLVVLAQNESGGLFGRTIEVAYEDERGVVGEAKKAAENLIVKRGAVALLGAVASAPAVAMAPVAERARTVMISPSATAPEVTEFGRFVFRVCYTDPFQASAMAIHAREALGSKRVGVLRDLGSEYSVRLARAFEATFVARGGEVVSAAFTAEDERFDGILEPLLTGEVEAIYLPGYDAEIRRIVTAARELGFEGRFLGADGWDTRALFELGDAAKGSRFTTHFSPDEPRAEVKRFVERYERTMNERPSALAALGHDAARAALLAIQRAEGIDREAIRRALSTMPAFEGATGTIDFDANGNVRKRAIVVELVGASTKFVTAVGAPGAESELRSSE